MERTALLNCRSAALLTASLASLSAITLAGCGSANRTVSTSSLASGGSTRSTGGRLTLKITWPKAKTRLIPVATTDIQLQVVSQIGIFTDTGINTKTVDVTQGTPSITVANVPAGPCLVQAFAIKKNADGTQITLATLDVPQSVNITANTDNPVSLTLDPTLTINKAIIQATIQKTFNADGSTPAASDPGIQPQLLTLGEGPFTDLQDGAVYKLTAGVYRNHPRSGVLSLPSSAFTFSLSNSSPAPFLIPVDANGSSLSAPLPGNVAYFKVDFAGNNGTVTATLNSDYGYPGSSLSDGFTLAAPALYTLTSLGSFTIPSRTGNVLLDSQGNLFGRIDRGSVDSGSIFEVAAGTSSLVTRASFNGTNGGSPNAELVLDDSGNLYGTTEYGGPNNDGTIFEIAAGTSTITTLTGFNYPNGTNPDTGLARDSNGNLYGGTFSGGNGNSDTLFKIAAGTSTVTTLVNVSGISLQDRPVLDSHGNLFGTTREGGQTGNGSIVELAAGASSLTTVASFGTNGVTGYFPNPDLVADNDGNLYGTTEGGGDGNGGTVFKVAVGTNAITTLASLNRDAGSDPRAGLLIDSGGNLYGTTSIGGPMDSGTVFEIVAGTTGIKTLYTFDTSTGYDPISTLAMDNNGNLYGTTDSGGANGYGILYKLTPIPSGSRAAHSQRRK